MQSTGERIFGKLLRLYDGDLDNTLLFSTPLMKEIYIAIDDILDRMYKDLNYAGKLYQIGVNFNKSLEEQTGVKPKKNDQIKAIVQNASPTDGLTLNYRIKRNKTSLRTNLMNIVQIGSAQNKSMYDIAMEAEKKIRGMQWANGTLMDTEANMMLNQQLLSLYKALGYKQVLFSAVMDTQTSDECFWHNGQVYDINKLEPLINLPPLHPNCRSILLPYGNPIK